MSYIRSISLCDESYQEAKNIGNLSKWVRQELLKDKHMREGVHTGTRKANPDDVLCNPMLTPTCSICWPYGTPQREDWIYYLNISKIIEKEDKTPDEEKAILGHNQNSIEEWVSNQARLNNPRNMESYTPIREAKKIQKKQPKLLQRLNPMRLLKFQ